MSAQRKKCVGLERGDINAAMCTPGRDVGQPSLTSAASWKPWPVRNLARAPQPSQLIVPGAAAVNRVAHRRMLWEEVLRQGDGDTA